MATKKTTKKEKAIETVAETVTGETALAEETLTEAVATDEVNVPESEAAVVQEEKEEPKKLKPSDTPFVKKTYKHVCHGGATFALRSGQDLSGDPGLIYQLQLKGIEFVATRAECV